MNIGSFIIALFTLLICLLTSSAQSVETEALIRASMIEKIAHFIQWPPFEHERFTLCVVEDTPLLFAIQSYYENISLADKPVALVVFKALVPKNCQVIFIGEENIGDLPGILQVTRDKPVLLVVEKKGAVKQGAHIDFFTEDKRLHLEVNRRSLGTSKFKVSYHLLKVAHIVE